MRWYCRRTSTSRFARTRRRALSLLHTTSKDPSRPRASRNPPSMSDRSAASISAALTNCAKSSEPRSPIAVAGTYRAPATARNSRRWRIPGVNCEYRSWSASSRLVTRPKGASVDPSGVAESRRIWRRSSSSNLGRPLDRSKRRWIVWEEISSPGARSAIHSWIRSSVRFRSRSRRVVFAAASCSSASRTVDGELSSSVFASEGSHVARRRRRLGLSTLDSAVVEWGGGSRSSERFRTIDPRTASVALSAR